MKSLFTTILILHLSNLIFGMTRETAVSGSCRTNEKIKSYYLPGHKELSDNSADTVKPEEKEMNLTCYEKKTARTVRSISLQTIRKSDKASDKTPQPVSDYFRIKSRILSIKKIYLSLKALNEKRRHYKNHKRRTMSAAEEGMLRSASDKRTNRMITVTVH